MQKDAKKKPEDKPEDKTPEPEKKQDDATEPGTDTPPDDTPKADDKPADDDRKKDEPEKKDDKPEDEPSDKGQGDENGEGADSKYLIGFDNLPKRIVEWKNKKLSYKGFSSTSIIRDASYINLSDKDIQLILVKKANQSGAAYVENISYNHLNNLKSEQEVLLQNSTEFSIINAQKFKGKIIMVVEVF